MISSGELGVERIWKLRKHGLIRVVYEISKFEANFLHQPWGLREILELSYCLDIIVYTTVKKSVKKYMKEFVSFGSMDSEPLNFPRRKAKLYYEALNTLKIRFIINNSSSCLACNPK